jgi:hypothetical protein
VLRDWLLAALLTLACLVSGCSYARAEPGLFGQSTTREATAPPFRTLTPHERAQIRNPDLPVVGEATWTSVDGLELCLCAPLAPT